MIKSLKIVDLLSNIYSYIIFLFDLLSIRYIHPLGLSKKTSKKKKEREKKGNKSNKEKLERAHEVLMFDIILSLYNLIRY